MTRSPVDPHSILPALITEGRFQEVLAAYRDLPSGATLAPDATLAVATAAARLALWPLARSLAGRALRDFTRRIDDDGAMRAANLLGADAIESGRLVRATRWFTQASHLARRLGDHLMTARTLNNLASVSLLQGNVTAARQVYREALLAYQRLGDRRGAAETYHNLSAVAREEGELAHARHASEHAVRHAIGIGEPGLIALTMTGQAETAVLGGDLAMATEELSRAAGYAEAARDPIGLAEIDRVLALRWWKANEPERALDAAERARLAAASHGSVLLRGESAALAGDSLKAMGRLEAAAERWREARDQFLRLGARRHLRRLPPGYQSLN